MTDAINNLTKQQRDFVEHYVLTSGASSKGGTEAAIAAGYSPKTATQQASRLLTNVNVKAAIVNLQTVKTSVFIKSKEEKLIWLENIATECMKINDPEKGMINPNAAINAIDKHNIMQGDNAPSISVSTQTIINADDNEW